MNKWHLLRPEILGLLGIMILCIVVKFTLRGKNKHVNKIPKEILPHLLVDKKNSLLLWLNILPVIAFSIGVVALAGPVKEKTVLQDDSPNITISIVMDLSDNMSEQKVEASKMLVYKLLDILHNEKVSLVLQAESTHVLLPFTSDYRLIKSYLKWVSHDIMPKHGNNLSSIKEKVDSPEDSDYHVVIYVTDQRNEFLYKEWSDLHLKADFTQIITTDKGNSIDKFLQTFLTDINNNAKIKIDKLNLKDSNVWKDEGYKLCWIATILLFPLFLRYRNRMMLIVPFIVISLTSCSYTSERINEAMTGFYLLKGDTFKAIDISHNSLERGILYIKQGMYEKALLEFSKDSTMASRYNAALATCYTGNYAKGLNMFRTLSIKYPDCILIKENIERLEKILYTEQSIQEKNNYNNDMGEMENYEKDKQGAKLKGDEDELWADKLINDNHDKFIYGKERSSRQGEILFKQIENNPKEFIKRKLEYEYLQEK